MTENSSNIVPPNEVNETAMPSVDDFVNRRWDDARETLVKLAPDSVSSLESEHRPQVLGLDMPQQFTIGDRPKRILSKKWHRVLEACLELTMQSRNLQVAAISLTADACEGFSRTEAGMRADYHFRSWFIHVAALSERTCDVIRKTAEEYIAESGKRTEVTKRYQNKVYEQVTKHVDQQRNNFLHAKRSWASGSTEEGLWEGQVTEGMILVKFLEEFHYPTVGSHVMAGKYGGLVCGTSEMLSCIGKSLRKFELELAGYASYETESSG